MTFNCDERSVVFPRENRACARIYIRWGALSKGSCKPRPRWPTGQRPDSGRQLELLSCASHMRIQSPRCGEGMTQHPLAAWNGDGGWGDPHGPEPELLEAWRLGMSPPILMSPLTVSSFFVPACHRLWVRFPGHARRAPGFVQVQGTP